VAGFAEDDVKVFHLAAMAAVDRFHTDLTATSQLKSSRDFSTILDFWPERTPEGQDPEPVGLFKGSNHRVVRKIGRVSDIDRYIPIRCEAREVRYFW